MIYHLILKDLPRYIRTVIITANVFWGFGFCLSCGQINNEHFSGCPCSHLVLKSVHNYLILPIQHQFISLPGDNFSNRIIKWDQALKFHHLLDMAVSLLQSPACFKIVSKNSLP